MGWDGASVSRSLRQLILRVRYLAMGGGTSQGVMAKQVTGQRGMMTNRGLA